MEEKNHMKTPFWWNYVMAIGILAMMCAVMMLGDMILTLVVR